MSNNTEDENTSSVGPTEEPQMRLASAHNTPPNSVGEAEEITFHENAEEEEAGRNLSEA